MAIYLQAIDPNVQNQSLLLSLAERMMNKAFEEGKIQDFESKGCINTYSIIY
jgi:hypothetical protein